MGTRRTFIIPDGLDGQRADAGLARLVGYSRSRIASFLTDGKASMDGQVLGKSDKLVAGALLDIDLDEPQRSATVTKDENTGLEILHLDGDIVVVAKPAGVAAHPSVGFEGPSVLGALAAEGISTASGGIAERQGIVHRLDVGTSGVMVVARSERAYSQLKDAFRNREVTKIYHALVHGHPALIEGTIDAPIGRDKRHDWKMAVMAAGRPSVTHYRTLEVMAGATLLEVHLETGRTHQIRVHMQALRHPCLGDPMYGGDPRLAKRLGLERQWLHAYRLAFTHPGTGKVVSYAAHYPDDLSHALELMRAGQR